TFEQRGHPYVGVRRRRVLRQDHGNLWAIGSKEGRSPCSGKRSGSTLKKAATRNHNLIIRPLRALGGIRCRGRSYPCGLSNAGPLWRKDGNELYYRSRARANCPVDQRVGPLLRVPDDFEKVPAG